MKRRIITFATIIGLLYRPIILKALPGSQASVRKNTLRFMNIIVSFHYTHFYPVSMSFSQIHYSLATLNNLIGLVTKAKNAHRLI